MFLRPGRRMPTPHKPIRTTALLAIVAALITTLLSTSIATASAQRAEATGLATGHAQVIASGVAPMPDGRVGWRVVGLDAQPMDDAPIAERSLGFALADEGEILVTDDATGDRTLLAPGEALLAQQGAEQQRASTGNRPVAYYMLELVVADDIENEETIGSGDLLFAGDAFSAPDGDRDLNLIRDVLHEGESTEIANSDAPILILATAGEIEVAGEDDDTTLDAGEAIVLGGPVEVEATEDGSAVVVAVIGDQVPEPTGRAERPEDDDDTGTFAVTTYACPAGMTIETLEFDACDTSGDSLVTWTLASDEFDTPGTPGIPDPEVDGPTTTWTGLPAGEYEILLSAASFVSGYEDYFIPSSNEVARADDDTTRLFYQSAGRFGSVRAYVFAAPESGPDGSGNVSVSVEIHTCPAGTPLENIQVEPCTEPLDGAEILLGGSALEMPLTLLDATGDGPAPTWTNLPYGDYCLLAANLSNGHDTIYAFGDVLAPTVAAVDADGVAAACFVLPEGGPDREYVYLYLVSSDGFGSSDPSDPDPALDADTGGTDPPDASEYLVG